MLSQEHRAGEKMFVDWAGVTIPIQDARTGELARASLLVAVLGASTYTFVRATLSQDLGHWVECRWFPIVRAPAWIAPAATSPT